MAQYFYNNIIYVYVHHAIYFHVLWYLHVNIMNMGQLGVSQNFPFYNWVIKLWQILILILECISYIIIGYIIYKNYAYKFSG